MMSVSHFNWIVKMQLLQKSELTWKYSLLCKYYFISQYVCKTSLSWGKGVDAAEYNIDANYCRSIWVVKSIDIDKSIVYNIENLKKFRSDSKFCFNNPQWRNMWLKNYWLFPKKIEFFFDSMYPYAINV